MGFKTPVEIAQASIAAGTARTLIPSDKLLFSGFLAGAYIGLGGLLAVIVGKGVNTEVLGLGLGKLLFASVFPIGLLLVVFGGAELFTGNCLFMPIAALKGDITWNDVFKNWLWVYAGNLIGSVFAAYFLATATGLLMTGPSHATVIQIAEEKVHLGWIQLFWRAVGCNWLVCMAIWLSLAAEDVIGKIFAMWFPIMAFAAIGFEHSIANMFFIPAGMFAGADVNLWQFFFSNLLPVTVGNIVGGFGIVAGGFYYLYVKDRDQASPRSSGT